MKDKRFLKADAPADSILKNTNIIEGNETFSTWNVSDFFFLLIEGQFLSHHFLRWFLRANNKNRFISSPCIRFMYFLSSNVRWLILLEWHCDGFKRITIEQAISQSYRGKKKKKEDFCCCCCQQVCFNIYVFYVRFRVIKPNSRMPTNKCAFFPPAWVKHLRYTCLHNSYQSNGAIIGCIHHLQPF